MIRDSRIPLSGKGNNEMGFQVIINGSLPDQDSEQALISALGAITADPQYGVTAASGTFDFSGSVTLPTPASDPVQADLEAVHVAFGQFPVDGDPTLDEAQALAAAANQLVADLQTAATGGATPPSVPVAAPPVQTGGDPVAQPVGGAGDPNAAANPQAAAAVAHAVPAEATPVAEQAAAAAGFALPEEAAAPPAVPVAQPQ